MVAPFLIRVGFIGLPLLGTLVTASHEQQSPLHASPTASDLGNTQGRHIAIVGAGIGGAFAAFKIHEHNRNLPPLKITIFEKESIPGGRTKSTYFCPLDGGLGTTEDGATHLFEGDWCLMSAIRNVGLKLEERPDWPRSWHQSRWIDDNARTDLKCNTLSTSWTEYLHNRWKYGQSWPIFYSAVQSTLPKWDEFGSPSHHPFKTIAGELQRVGLHGIISGPADSYLQNLTISSQLQRDVIQPCARGRFQQNLASISGLSSILAAGTSRTGRILYGNSRLVERLIRLSEADLELESLVTAIEPGFSKRYRLVVSRLAPNGSSAVDTVEVDKVIFAAPLANNDINLSFNMRTSASAGPRIDTFVTHFASPVTISSNLSILPLDVNILDEMTLTTSTKAEQPDILNLQRSKTCFMRHCHPDDGCDQCDDDNILYRVQSRWYLQDSDIIRMLGRDPEENSKLSDHGIYFVRRQAWPQALPQASEGDWNFVDDVEIAPKFYYLNGAESVVSSMEMSCRMGRNVAYLQR